MAPISNTYTVLCFNALIFQTVPELVYHFRKLSISDGLIHKFDGSIISPAFPYVTILAAYFPVFFP